MVTRRIVLATTVGVELEQIPRKVEKRAAQVLGGPQERELGAWGLAGGRAVGRGGSVPGRDGATAGDAWGDGGAGRWGPLLGAVAGGEEVGGKQGLWAPVKFRTQWAGEVPCARGPEPRLPRGPGCALQDTLEGPQWGPCSALFVGCVRNGSAAGPAHASRWASC